MAVAERDNPVAEDRRDDDDRSITELLEEARIEEVLSEDSDSDFEDVTDETEINGPPFPGKLAPKSSRISESNLTPWLQSAAFNLLPTDPDTKTTEAQAEVREDCLPLLTLEDTQNLPVNNHGLPHLRREAHANFLRDTMKPLPAVYKAADASRPWMFLWALCGLSFVGEDVTHYADRLRQTLRPMQHPQGGFGGGYGQMAHCAATYGAVNALAAARALDMVDRDTLWSWLGRLKQSDGGFRMALDAEEDIRGAYCAMCIISLLGLPIELPPDAPARADGLTTFLDNLGEWVGRCQTYEGGIGGAPDNEAHGAYAFCALGCLCAIDAPQIVIPKYLDVQALVAWLAARQASPEGGFAGRQEKLVDACYSHWVGGCWSLLEAALGITPGTHGAGDIWNREALIRYLLCCAQAPGKKGGMRDKPSMRPDGYHTAYSLAGLSHAQNKFEYDLDGMAQDQKIEKLTAGFNWKARRPSKEEMRAWKLDEKDMLEFVHPVFTLPMDAVNAARDQFGGSEL